MVRISTELTDLIGLVKKLRMEKDIRELHNKLDKVLVATQKPIHFVGEFDEQGPSFDNVNKDGLTQEEINYIANQQSGKELQAPKPNEQIGGGVASSDEQIGGGVASSDEQKNEDLKREPAKEKAKEVEKAPELEKPYVPPPPYQPKITFPGRFKKKILDKAKAVFEKHLENTQMTLPIVEAFLMIPQLGKFLKDAILNKTKELQSTVILSHECSAIIQRRSVPRKLSDPGSFTLPCAIGPLKFSSYLCDLGASVSLMPYSVAKRLGFKSYKPAKISLILADRSSRLR
ncbi:uncharacterized protein LOC112084594 [Eutrema salsugineum]|uniref:uncharacterized protein LOC112084594 n=1 Tax=Eutrema salsugineum TaxID=72664 RepID=UPI000CED7474|nr:uncharacterized protein LOC112084594 [Eutrema salsugineum]